MHNVTQTKRERDKKLNMGCYVSLTEPNRPTTKPNQPKTKPNRAKLTQTNPYNMPNHKTHLIILVKSNGINIMQLENILNFGPCDVT